MKAKTAQWKIKEAYNKWNPEEDWDEFWQEVLEILRQFEKEIRKENK